MAIKIGHATIDENEKARGGAAGDNNGKEVCTRKWYDGGWHTVLRPKTAATAEKSAKACEAGCANKNIGYDQNQRNTLHTQAKAVGFDLAKITTPCECDCSSFMHVCAIAGGANLAYGSNAMRTANMVAGFVESGDYEKLTASKYLKSDAYLKRGDILVKSGHTVMVLENGAKANEEYCTIQLPVLTKGATGEAVKTLQIMLNAKLGSKLEKPLTIDGDFGKNTDNAFREYQRTHKDESGKELAKDGSCGPKSWGSLLKV